MVKIQIEEYLKKQLVIAAILNIGHIMIGYGIGWSSPVIPKLQNETTTPLSHVITKAEASWISSCFLLGVVLGPHISGPISNTIGRKLCLMLGGTLNTLAQFLIIFAQNTAMIYAGRVICGLGLGMLVVNNVVYIGEYASTNIRGIILTSTGVFHTLGMLISYVVGPATTYAGMGYVLLGFGIAHLLATLYIPESPIYYVIKGQEEKAKEVLRYLGRDKDIERELKDIVQETKGETVKNFDIRDLFRIKSNRKSFLITVALFIFQQGCGSLAAQSFSTTIFQSSGSTIDSDLSTIIVGLTQFLGTLIVPILIERAGRKTLLLISISGCGLGMAVLGVYFYLVHIKYEAIDSIGWLPLVTLVAFFVSFSVGLNVIPNTLMGEMFQPKARSVGSSISLTIGTAAGFISITTFGYIVDALGNHFAFWLYAIVNVCALIFTIAFVPETKGMSLSEIEVMLAK